LDNAANHTGKDNTVLEEWLWTELMVLVLFLPVRAPEWNPIELMWNCMVQWLKYFDILQLTGSHRVVKALQASSTRSPMVKFTVFMRRVGSLIYTGIKCRSR
jgi:hypothetical protein